MMSGSRLHYRPFGGTKQPAVRKEDYSHDGASEWKRARAGFCGFRGHRLGGPKTLLEAGGGWHPCHRKRGIEADPGGAFELGRRSAPSFRRVPRCRGIGTVQRSAGLSTQPVSTSLVVPGASGHGGALSSGILSFGV